MEKRVLGIVKYIFDNEPVTFSSLRERAKTKEWYTDDVFYKLIESVGKHPRMSVTVHGEEMIYRQKRSFQREAPIPLFSVIAYPEMIAGVNDASQSCMNDMCFCSLSYTRQERKELKMEIHDKDCPRYERDQDTSGNTQIPFPKRDILLEAK